MNVADMTIFNGTGDDHPVEDDDERLRGCSSSVGRNGCCEPIPAIEAIRHHRGLREDAVYDMGVGVVLSMSIAS